MADALLRSKLWIAPPRPSLVARERLLSRLNGGLRGKLTIVAAAAGYGKTTLITHWLQQQNRPTAWLSLDPTDNTPARFFAHIIAAIQTVQPTFAENLAASLRSSGTTDLEAITVALLNELLTCETVFNLVLDDFHVLTDPNIHDAMRTLLDYLPPVVHLVVISRTAPPLQVPRLRVRNQVNEIDSAELRFTLAETRLFLQQTMGLTLPDSVIAGLHERTEGWPAALQLAALSLQRRVSDSAETNSAENFLAQFSGTDRHITDYLLEEVLDQQSAEIQTFLLQTSILETLDAELCDTVCQHTTSRTILDQLERKNLFLIPLDDHRHRYRYHHLFSHLLRQRLHQTCSHNAITELHRRAATCHERRKELQQTVAHALQIDDHAAVARLIAAIPLHTVYFEGGGLQIAEWAKQLPDAVIRAEPLAGAIAGAAALIRGDLETVRRLLPLLDDAPEVARHAAIYRSVIVRNEADDHEQAIALAQRALDAETGNNDFVAAIARVQIAVCRHVTGQLEEADQTLRDMRDALHGDDFAAKTLLLYAIDLQMHNAFALGNLAESVRLGQEGLEKANGNSPLIGLMYSGLGYAYYEWNDLERAQEYTALASDLGQRTGISDIIMHSAMLRAKLACLHQDRTQVEQILSDVTHHFARARAGSIDEQLRNTAAWYRLLVGDLDAAIREMDTSGMSLQDVPAFYDFNRYHTLVAVRLAESRRAADGRFLPELLLMLDRLQQQSIRAGHRPALLRCLLARALTLDLAGKPAETVLADALELASQCNLVRTVLDEGEPLRVLLARTAIDTPFARRLQQAFAAQSGGSVANGISVQLTGRESQILHLIEAGLSNREIEQKLVISKNTVRTHIKNLYGKLSAESRTQAIRRARELQLI